MKTRIAMLGMLVLGFISTRGQLIQGSIEKTPGQPNQVDVYMKPNFTQNSTYLFQLQFPIAFDATAAPAPTGLTVTLDPTFVATFVGSTYSVSVYAQANSLSGPSLKYYVISLVRSAGSAAANSAAQSWTSGTEYKVMTVGFQNTSAPLSKVKLADWADGGSDGQGNFYTLSGTGLYYVDGGGGGGVSTNNFYSRPGTSVVNGTASNGFAETTADVALPVEMLSFSGYRSGANNVLSWKTSTEVNNRGFEVQRSADGINYIALGFVDSRAAGGNSTSELNYGFTDNNAAAVKYYYRLRQLDIDNRSKFSNVVVISGGKPSLLGIGGIYPNPASSMVNIRVDAPQNDKLSVLVRDISGRLVIQQESSVTTGSNTISLAIASLPAGTYTVNLVCANGCDVTGKFVKQ